MHPNSLKALARAQQDRKKGEEGTTRVNMSLTKEAIAALDEEAKAQGVSRSEIVERYAQVLKQRNASDT
ncbi:MAG: ribbon-helix-helix domain-containing protein [Cyanobacteriota bacterium]